jgi:hypothetical protein
MRKSKKENEAQNIDSTWVPDDEDYGNHEPEDFIDDEIDSSYKVSRRTRLAWKAQENISKKWFKTLVKHFGRNVFDIGPGDFGPFVQSQRYAPRAQYLLQNKWVTAQYGIYLIEYTIVANVAQSFYSLNYGIRYIYFMESDLTKSQKKNEKILVELFKETEEFLHKTLADRTPPYTPNYLFR